MPAQILETYSVFLSHSSEDKPVIEEIARRLAKSGLTPWLDAWNLIPGEPWQPALEDAIRHCDCCAVFIGAGEAGPWQREEMRTAINRRVTDTEGRFRVIPVILPGGRKDRRNMPDFLVNATWVEFGETLDDEHAFHRLVCGIRGIAPGPGPGQAIYEGECPYRGLQFFDVADAGLFFGRRALAARLVDAIRPEPGGSGHRFLGLIGPSGSGKSSLARAGLLAAIRRGEIPGSANWPIAACRPGASPLESLAVCLVQANGDRQTPSAVREKIRELAEDERTLHQFTRLWLGHVPDRRFVVLVDQMEELFTMCGEESERRAVIDNLVYASSVRSGQTIVVVTLRAEVYGECCLHPGLASILSARHFLVGPMSEAELREAIGRPAQLTGWEFEPGLIDALLNDVREQPGCLPLLQYTLRELWARRKGRRLTHAAYDGIGRVAGAIERRAEAIYGDLSQSEQRLCRWIFLRLVQPVYGGRYVRRVAAWNELMPAGENPAIAESVIAKLSGPESRLLIVEAEIAAAEENVVAAGVSTEDGGLRRSRTSAGATRHVEIAHEALIRSWERLRTWLNEHQEFQLWQKRLRLAQEEWERADRHPDSLLRGLPLDEAEQWVLLRSNDLPGGLPAVTREEQDFVEASKNFRDMQRAENEARQRAFELEQARRLEAEQRRAETEARSASRLRKLALLLLALFLAAGISAYYWKRAARLASSRALAAAATSSLTGTHRGQPVLLALYAVGTYESREAKEALHEAVQFAGGPALWGHKAAVRAVAFSGDGKLIATSGDDNTARLWDAQTGAELRPCFPRPGPCFPHTEPVHSVALSPDGRLLATGSTDDRARIWDLAAAVEPFVLEHGGDINSVEFSPRGDLLATGSSEGAVFLWDVATRRRSPDLSEGKAAVWHVAFSRASDRLAAASSDGTFRIWDALKRVKLHTGRIADSPADSLAFDPDGLRLAVAGKSHVLEIFDTRSWRRLLDISADADGLDGIAFSPDGELVATAGRSGIGRLWDAASGAEILALIGRKGQQTAVAFPPPASYRERPRVAFADTAGHVRIYLLDLEQLKNRARKLIREAYRLPAGKLPGPVCRKYLGVDPCPPLP
jgi:WD40 repeat protein